MYSTSGLLKESQLDIVSSIETEFPSDLLGETSMLHGPGKAKELGTASSLLGAGATFGRTTALGLTLKDAGRLLAETPLLPLQAGGPFFTLAILFVQGTFRYEIQLIRI